MAQTTTEAFGVSGIAVQFYDLHVGDTRGLVQAIYILRYHGGNFARIDQAGNGAVASIWLGGGHGPVHGELAAPGFPAHFLGCHEITEIYRFVFGP